MDEVRKEFASKGARASEKRAAMKAGAGIDARFERSGKREPQPCKRPDEAEDTQTEGQLVASPGWFYYGMRPRFLRTRDVIEPAPTALSERTLV